MYISIFMWHNGLMICRYTQQLYPNTVLKVLLIINLCKFETFSKEYSHFMAVRWMLICFYIFHINIFKLFLIRWIHRSQWPDDQTVWVWMCIRMYILGYYSQQYLNLSLSISLNPSLFLSLSHTIIYTLYLHTFYICLDVCLLISVFFSVCLLSAFFLSMYVCRP